MRDLGGSASIDEIVSTIVEKQGLTEEQQQTLHANGPQTELEYRLAWARTHLKFMGLLEIDFDRVRTHPADVSFYADEDAPEDSALSGGAVS